MAVTNGWGQGVINNIIEWGRGATNNAIGWGSVYDSSESGQTSLNAAANLLLDQYSGAAAAYSVRKLSSSYSGSALRVRRSSDNAEQDIGFDGNDLDTSALTTFVGANDGFVTTWYDQSGNGDNITQTTASTQPQIVSSGSLVTLNSKAGVDFGSGDLLTTTLSTTITQPNTYLITFENGTSAGTQRHYVEINDPNYVIGKLTTGEPMQYAGTFLSGSTVLNTGQQYLQSGLFNTTSSSLRLNGVEDASGNVGSRDNSTNFVMGGNLANPIIGIIQEYIIYNTNNSASLADIESNINAYYNIYWDGSQTGLLDDYPSASAAYSVRALNSAYTDPILRVRRSSDNAEQDIRALYDGNLDEEGLLNFVGANDGFVVTWYDQSGNGNDATNSTASQQPQIVSSGSLNTINSKASLSFDTTDNLLLPSLSVTNQAIFSVFNNSSEITNATGLKFMLYSSTSFITFGSSSGTVANERVYWATSSPSTRSVAENTTNIPSGQHLLSMLYDTVNLDTMHRDGVEYTLVDGSLGGFTDSIFPTNYNRIGNTSNSLNDNLQELIVFGDDKTATRAPIESNINAYYNIN